MAFRPEHEIHKRRFSRNLGVGLNVRLNEQGRLVGVDTGSDVLRCGGAGALTQFFRVLGNRDGVEVNNAIERIELVLHGDPVTQSTDVVSEVEGVARGLHSGENDGLSHEKS